MNSIQRDTLVWYKGLDDWTKAENFSEFNDYFKSIPPLLPSEKKKEVKEIYDEGYEKETEATMLGIIIAGLFIGLYFVQIKLFPDVEPTYFLGFGALVKVACAIYAGRIAKELNRNQGVWFISTLFLTSISLIILGQLPRLNERRVSGFELELEKVNREES